MRVPPILKIRGVVPVLLVLAVTGWQLWVNGGREAFPKSDRARQAQIQQEMAGNFDGSYPCAKHAPNGQLPTVPPGSMLIADDLFCWSLNPTTKFPDWVAYRLDRDLIDPDCPIEQTRDWTADPYLDPALVLEPEDYTGAYEALGTDRGHLAPLRSFCGSKYWRETNQITNVAPQRSALNRGVWKDLEAHVRDLAMSQTVYVVTGTAYLHDMPQLPGADEDHQVPSHFWKVIRTEDDVLGEAFWFDQESEARSFWEGAIGVGELEGTIGLGIVR